MKYKQQMLLNKVYLYVFKASISKLDLWKETYKGKYKGVTKWICYAMHPYSIRLIAIEITMCVIEIKISDKHKLEQKKSSIAITL